MPNRNEKAPRSNTTAVTNQRVKQPVAPSVYRPLPVPKVLQRKISSGAMPKARQASLPVAPPVFRPQPVPKVLQTKSASAYSPESRSAKRPLSPFPSAPFSVPAVRSRSGVSLQCAMRPRASAVAKPSYEELLQAAKDLGLLSETVNDAISRSPIAVDQALRNGLQRARNLGVEAQTELRYENPELNPALPRAYADLLALYDKHQRAVKSYYQSDDYLRVLINKSNEESWANNPLTGGKEYRGQ
jgi:hypothetical protein